MVSDLRYFASAFLAGGIGIAIGLVLGWSDGALWVVGMAGALGSIVINDLTSGVLKRRPRRGQSGSHRTPTSAH